MKGKKCIKYLILCITCLLSLSHCLDAKALTYNGVNLDYTGNHFDSVGGKVYTISPNNTLTLSSTRHVRFTASTLSTANVTKIEFPSNINVEKDKYYVFTIGFQNYNIFQPITWNFESSDTHFQIMSIQPLMDNSWYDTGLGYCNKWTVSGSTYTCVSVGGVTNRTVTYFEIVLKPYEDGNFKPIIENSDTFFRIYYGLDGDTLVYVSELKEYRVIGVGADDLNEKDDQDRQDIEQQSSSTEQSADTASEDVGGATTNIIGAINGFATAVTNIQAGTCILPEISAYGMNLGRLNLCTYSPPAWVQGLTSTILSLITLKMAISIFYRIMGLLDGVLGGKK